MKLFPFLLLALLAALGNLRAQTDEDPFPPPPIPPDRYDAMMKRSPFVLPTVEEETVSVGWTSDYQIVSVLRTGDEFVVLAKKLSTNEHIPIRTKENIQGIRLVDLQMSPDPREVSATIELGGAEGTIQYAPSILSGVPTSQAPRKSRH